jgi:hypothetical protein
MKTKTTKKMTTIDLQRTVEAQRCPHTEVESPHLPPRTQPEGHQTQVEGGRQTLAEYSQTRPGIRWQEWR